MTAWRDTDARKQLGQEVQSIKQGTVDHCLPGEVWLDVPGYEGIYMVSNMGRVRRVQFGEANGHVEQTSMMGKFLKPFPCRTGHLQVKLYTNGQAKQLFVHRLVAAAFLGDIPEGYHVHHRDGDKTNNRLDNLEVLDAVEHLKLHGRGMKNPKAILDPGKVKQIRALLKQGITVTEIASLYNVHPNTIKDIRNGRRWAHVSDQFAMPLSRGFRHAPGHHFAMPVYHHWRPTCRPPKASAA